MKNPLSFVQDKIIIPVVNMQKAYFSKEALHKGCESIANFIFDKSKETALVMLIFNAVSILSSHISQIKGLKKSTRENKDYLIRQEKTELGLDCILTIIPPFFLNNFLSKKLDSGQWITKSSLEKLKTEIPREIGISEKDLFNTDHIVPAKETLVNGFKSIVLSLKEKNRLPKWLANKIHFKGIDVNTRIPAAQMQRILKEYDMSKGNVKNTAYDAIWGQRNGLLVMSAITYSIVASNIIMPILKNKISNHYYKKHLMEKGETPDSIRRKNRYNNLMTENVNYKTGNDSNIFNIFETNVSTPKKPSVERMNEIDRGIYKDLLEVKSSNLFKDITSFSNTNTQSNGLRI